MRKLKIILTLVMSCVLVSITSVNAKDCTGYTPSPAMPQVIPSYKTRVFNLITESNQCKGSNTEVWFNNYKGWEGAAWDSVINVSLIEDDPPKYEPDEEVKSYILHYDSDGYFHEIVVKNWNLGNIDSNGDKQCEFYLSLYSSGQKYQTTPKDVFTFNICMK